MQKALIGILIVFICSSFCLNLYHVNENGQEFYDSELISLPIFYQSFNQSFYEGLIKKIDHDFHAGHPDSHKALSDKSVALIKLGKVKEAQQLLLKLYKEDPTEYNFVANLGTSYELTNQLDSALFLIKKALTINQNSHRGSEWFHVKVLEAKQKMISDPNWLKHNKVLNIQFPELKQDSIVETDTITKIIHDIGYQLAERIPFSPVKDLLLSNIFNEYGELLSKYSVQMGYVVYAIGEKYDNENVFNFPQKKAKLETLIQKHNLKMPKISDFYPAKTAFNKNPTTMMFGPEIHQDMLNDPIFEYLNIISFGIGIFVLSLIFAVVLSKFNSI